MRILNYQKGDRICHYELRQPLTITAVLKSRKTGAVKLKLETGQLIDANDTAIQFYPQPGDRVVIATAPYQHWYSETIAAMPYSFSGSFKNYSKVNREWIERYSPDRFPWGEVFTFKQQQGDMALIAASGERYKLPVFCLRVLTVKRALSSSQGVNAA